MKPLWVVVASLAMLIPWRAQAEEPPKAPDTPKEDAKPPAASERELVDARALAATQKELANAKLEVANERAHRLIRYGVSAGASAALYFRAEGEGVAGGVMPYLVFLPAFWISRRAADNTYCAAEWTAPNDVVTQAALYDALKEQEKPEQPEKPKEPAADATPVALAPSGGTVGSKAENARRGYRRVLAAHCGGETSPKPGEVVDMAGLHPSCAGSGNVDDEEACEKAIAALLDMHCGSKIERLKKEITAAKATAEAKAKVAAEAPADAKANAEKEAATSKKALEDLEVLLQDLQGLLEKARNAAKAEQEALDKATAAEKAAAEARVRAGADADAYDKAVAELKKLEAEKAAEATLKTARDKVDEIKKRADVASWLTLDDQAKADRKLADDAGKTAKDAAGAAKAEGVSLEDQANAAGAGDKATAVSAVYGLLMTEKQYPSLKANVQADCLGHKFGVFFGYPAVLGGSFEIEDGTARNLERREITSILAGGLAIVPNAAVSILFGGALANAKIDEDRERAIFMGVLAIGGNVDLVNIIR